jgi:hypothetical protein
MVRKHEEEIFSEVLNLKPRVTLGMHEKLSSEEGVPNPLN